MKILYPILLMALTLSAVVPAVQAQETAEPLNIAVININAIRQNATVVKSIAEQIGKFRIAFQAEIKKEEETLRQANQELSRQRTLLAADAFAEKRREFEQRVSQVQRLVQQRKGNLDRAQAQSMGQVQDVLNKIVTDLANERGYNLILRREQTVLAGKALDITAQVLDALNKELPSLTVSEPVQ